MFIPLIQPPGPPEGLPLVIAVRGNRVDIREDDATGAGLFLGTLAGRHCWAVDADDAPVVDDETYRDLHRLYGAVDDSTWTLAGRAVQLVEWARTHRFCGRCANPTDEVVGERARRCPACGLLAFPRLAPAVIMLIERDDGRALLARGRAFPMPMYSCLAGFVEPGETIEQAVVREVREEIGVTVGDLRYWGSQPWPFPHSLMIGFQARWESGEIDIDETEIADAQWFSVDELPMIPPPMSIARRLIDDWIDRASS